MGGFVNGKIIEILTCLNCSRIEIKSKRHKIYKIRYLLLKKFLITFTTIITIMLSKHLGKDIQFSCRCT